MPLNDDFPLAVSFLIAERDSGDGTRRPTPIGTAFIVNVPGRNMTHEYLVTAKHVVEAGSVSARFRTQAGVAGVEGAPLWIDVSMNEWFHHPTADVSIAVLPPDVKGELHRKHIPGFLLAASTRDSRWRPDLGDRAYFVGLLSLPGYPEMGDANTPMVRGGVVGALYQKGVPVMFRKTVRRIEAHLIDCRSHEGFSGSPCFFQRDDVPLGVAMAFGGGLPPGGNFEDRGTQTYMLGLVSGHFDAWERSEVSGDVIGEIRAKINSGVGVVTPVDAILEVMGMDEAREQREQAEKDAAPAEIEDAATADRVGGNDEYERFEELTRRLANTPKPKTDGDDG